MNVRTPGSLWMRVAPRSTRHLDSCNSHSTPVLKSSISPRPKNVRTLALLNRLFSFEAENADALDDADMSGDSKRVRLAARTTSALFSQSPVCGVFWGTEMGWSLPGGGGRGGPLRARGRPRPVLRFCRRNIRRCPGVLYAHKARSTNRVCNGGVQVVLFLRLPASYQ